MENQTKQPTSGNIKAQIVIFVLGIIVSGAFFILSYVVVDLKITQLSMERQANTQKLVTDDFSRIETHFLELFSSIKPMSSDALGHLREQQLSHSMFSNVIWVDAKQLSLLESVPSLRLFGSANSGVLNAQQALSLKSAYKVFSKTDLGVVKRINDGYKSGQGITVVSLMRRYDGTLGILVAQTLIDNVLSQPIVYQNMGVTQVSFLSDKSPFMEQKFSHQSQFGSTQSYDFSAAQFNEVYKVRLQLRTTYTEMLLKTIPYGVLSILLIMTLAYMVIRTLASRRAFEMQSLNQILANRNIALKQEVKKRKRMNIAVRQSEQENRAIINSINEVVFELDSDGKICFINDTWRRVTGYDLSESINESLLSYIEEGKREYQEGKLKNMIDGRGGAYTEFLRLKAKDGHFKPIEMSLSMIRQDQQKNLRVVGTLTDLEEKEKAERAIVEAEENYKRIWKNAANGIYEQDLGGKLMSANPAMADILGYDTPGVLLRTMVDMTEMVYVFPDEKRKHIEEAIKEGSSRKFEIRAYRQDRVEIWLNEFIQPVFNDDGKLMHLEGTIDNITDRKNTDIAMRKAKVESDMANRAKSDFIANMSHELRTPLNSIMGFAEIIRDQVMGDIAEPAYSEYAGEIHKSGKGLLSIINQILDVSKIEAGDREINESLVKLSKVSSETLALFTETIKEKQLTVVNTIDETVSELIAEDRSVRQMLYNLVSNAVKFTPNKGVITFGMSYNEDDDMCVSLEDTGEGLTPEQVERALQPFDLMDGEHSREGYGVGLGLTLVKLLMDMHGGYINIESEKDRGTKITLIFPKKRVRQKRTSEAQSVSVEALDGSDVFDSGSKSVH